MGEVPRHGAAPLLHRAFAYGNLGLSLLGTQIHKVVNKKDVLGAAGAIAGIVWPTGLEKMELARKLLRLGGTERRLLVCSALLLVAVRVGLWLLPFRTLERMLAARSGWKADARGRGVSVEAVAWAVETAGRCVPQAATCLTRALAAQVLLRRRGHPALIHIGAARDEGGRFSAHAWVESGGRVVIGGHELERYTLLTTLGGKAS